MAMVPLPPACKNSPCSRGVRTRFPCFGYSPTGFGSVTRSLLSSCDGCALTISNGKIRQSGGSSAKRICPAAFSILFCARHFNRAALFARSVDRAIRAVLEPTDELHATDAELVRVRRRRDLRDDTGLLRQGVEGGHHRHG